MTYKTRLISYLFISLGLFAVFIFLVTTQNQNNPSQTKVTKDNTASKEPTVLGSTLNGYTWEQTSFTGGVNQGPFAITWNSIGGWSSYSSATNATINSSGVKSANGSSGEFISSIFDQGIERSNVFAVLDTSGISSQPSTVNYPVYWRGADSSSGVSSASWTLESFTGYTLCPLPYRFIQYKIVLPIAVDSNPNVTTSKVLFANTSPLSIAGVVTDAATGNRIGGAAVTANGQTTTATLNKPNHWDGIYSLNVTYSNPLTVTVSGAGYTSQTKSYPIKTLAPGCYESIPEANFVLTKSSSGGSSGSVIPPSQNKTNTSEPSNSTPNQDKVVNDSSGKNQSSTSSTVANTNNRKNNDLLLLITLMVLETGLIAFLTYRFRDAILRRIFNKN